MYQRMATSINRQRITIIFRDSQLFRRFIKNFAQIPSPLTRLLEKTVDFVWNEDCERSFSTLKRLLAENVTLAFPDFTRPFRVATDASSIAVGTVLSQIQTDSRERPKSFISRTFNKTERKWTTIEKETYAIIWALNQLRSYLCAQKFEIVTDHKPLIYSKSLSNPSPKISRWQMQLAELDAEINYRQGKLNTNANVLTRMSV